jgi:hypothetical protein
MKNDLVHDDYQIQIVHVPIFLIIFGSYVFILFIVRVMILQVTIWLYKLPPPKPINYEDIVQFLCNTCFHVVQVRYAPNHST